jgi:hypothetical protein
VRPQVSRTRWSGAVGETPMAELGERGDARLVPDPLRLLQMLPSIRPRQRRRPEAAPGSRGRWSSTGCPTGVESSPRRVLRLPRVGRRHGQAHAAAGSRSYQPDPHSCGVTDRRGMKSSPARRAHPADLQLRSALLIVTSRARRARGPTGSRNALDREAPAAQEAMTVGKAPQLPRHGERVAQRAHVRTWQLKTDRRFNRSRASSARRFLPAGRGP